MARTDNAKTLWRVQVRRAYHLKWQNKGLFETRDAARWQAKLMRSLHHAEGKTPGGGIGLYTYAGYGFGNTRVVKHIRGEKK